jgi:GNAT superfamily N-acetyltransferase
MCEWNYRSISLDRLASTEMSKFTIGAASSVEHARSLLVGATAPNAGFTQTSNFSDEKIDRALRLGFRKPEWIWFAAEDNGVAQGVVLGVVAGWGAAARETAGILDFLDLPTNPEIAAALLERAVSDSSERGRRSIEIIHFIPNESTLADPDLAGLIDTLAASGFRILVRRRRYRLPVLSSPVTIPETELTFEALTAEDDPRLAVVLAEILVGSLDAHDIAALVGRDLTVVAAETAREFLESDPFDSFFLAVDPTGSIVGLVVGGLRGSPDIGVASFIGVSHLHRGHGYAAQLLGWITKRMIADNAQTLIGETDDDNFPMDAAFRRVGYPHAESRIDFVREIRAKRH